MKTKPMSVSAYQTYMECPHKFKLQYIDRIRSVVQPSYFIFGSAVDKGLNTLLVESGSAIEACEQELKRLVVEQVEFLPNDYDGEILDEKTREVLLQKCREFGYQGSDIDSLASTLLAKPYAELSENQRKALALCCTASLKVKAILMFEAYRTKVMPLIKKVESIQQEIRWQDNKGNDFVGVLDLPAEVTGHGPLIADNKTSSNPERDYDQDCVRTSLQLGIYAKVTGKKHGAYFVLGKNIKKNRVKTCSECGNVGQGRHKTCDKEIDGIRCGGDWTETIQPEAEVRIVIDEIPEETQNIAQEALSGVAEAVKKGCFPHNLKACVQKFGPRKSVCPYYEFCRNGNLDGLQTKDKK